MLESFGISDAGCVRANNEDFYVLSGESGLYVVADGMGGAQAGEHASKLAAETVVKYLSAVKQPDAQALSRAFDQANHEVIEAASNDLELEGMGTTLVAALESGPEVLVASVGDSRAYVYTDGKLTALTEDQTWVHEVGRRLGIDEVSLKTHPMRHVLTMAIGVSPELRVHSYVVKLEPGVQVLLCSDGLHGVVDPAVIEETLASGDTLESKCRRLIDAAKKAGGPDNITAVLLRAK